MWNQDWKLTAVKVPRGHGRDLATHHVVRQDIGPIATGGIERDFSSTLSHMPFICVLNSVLFIDAESTLNNA
jgi:hypothetical protein